MTEQPKNPQLEIDELARTVDEYRKRIDEVVRKERDKYRQQVDEESNAIIEGAWQKAEAIVAEAQQKAAKSREGLERKAREEAEVILSDSRRQAQQIVAEAEERIKKEARNRIKLEAEKLIDKAREEAKNISTQAQAAADTEANDTITKAKQEAERLLNDVRESCRTEVRAQTKQVLTEVRARAERVIEEVVRGSTDIGNVITETTLRAERLTEKFKHDLQLELAESSRLISDARQKLERAMAQAISQSEAAATIDDIHEELNNNAIISVELRGEKAAGSHDSSPLFQGQMEMKTLSSCPYLQIKKLKSFLAQIPNIKLVEEYASETETTLLFEVKAPMPLFDILTRIPSVEESVAEGDNVRLVLRD